MTTKTIPTDRNGQPYYGPTTYAAAVQWIDESAYDTRTAAERCAVMLADAGYSGLAARVRREYGLPTT